MSNEQFERMVDAIWMAHKEQIIHDGDWWFGTETYDINFHKYDNEFEEPAVIRTCVYRVPGNDSYNTPLYTQQFYLNNKGE
jgi:sugar lactone lactonase YvrE